MAGPMVVRGWLFGGPAPSAVSVTLHGDVDAPGQWRASARRRTFEPVLFDARGRTVWVVFRPTEHAVASLTHTVVVGGTTLLACRAALVVATHPVSETVGGLSVEWSGSLLPVGCTTLPDDPVVGTRPARCDLVVPIARARGAAHRPTADSEPAGQSGSEDDEDEAQDEAQEEDEDEDDDEDDDEGEDEEVPDDDEDEEADEEEDVEDPLRVETDYDDPPEEMGDVPEDLIDPVVDDPDDESTPCGDE
jgi:hypothetical protein